MEEKDADNIGKVLFKSFIRWFWELNLCSYKYRVVLFWFAPLSVFFCCCWSTLKRKSRNITKHLMSGPSGNQLVLFSLESWCFPQLRLGKHQDSWENKTNCFPRDLTLSVYIYISASFSCYKVMWLLIEQKYVKEFTKSSELYIAGKFGQQNHLFTGVKGFLTPALFPCWCP